MPRSEVSRCFVCQSTLGCAVDCGNAPWNFDLPRTTPRGYLKRLVKWIRDIGHYPVPLPFRPDLHWL